MDYTKLEHEVITMMQNVRQNPKILVEDLQKMLQHFQGNTYKDPVSRVNIITNEGPGAVHEAISFLKSCSSAPPVRVSKGLTQAARDHCYDIGPKGLVSHTGHDGSTMSERMERYGQWNRAIAENISFSEKSGKDIILQFIIDDGNASRGHRKNLFNSDYMVIGVSCGYHKEYEVCAILDLAAEYDDELEKRNKNTAPPQNSYASPDTHQQSAKPDKEHMAQQQQKPQKRERSNERKQQNSDPANFDEDEAWPEDAVKCSIKKMTKTQGNKKLKQTTKLFTMKDGSIETHEYRTEEFL